MPLRKGNIMITSLQIRRIQFLAAHRGIVIADHDLFSLTAREADRILARLAA